MTKVAGRFHLRVVNAETGDVRQEREFDNLVTDIGLEYYAKGWNSYNFECVVGTGAREPSPSDTNLTAFLTATNVAVTTGGINAAPDYARWQRLTGRFNAGAILNTISEIGIRGSVENILWCRQLILDEHGQPSTITVLPNEYLDVTYTLYTYPNLTDRVFSFVMDGVTYNCIGRLALAARSPHVLTQRPLINIKELRGSHVFSTQTLGDITGQPTGTSVVFSVNASYLPWEASSPNSRTCSLTLDLSAGNVSGGIGSMLVYDNDGMFYHQLSFTPVLPKDASTKITLIFSDTVSRYSAP